MTAAIRTDSVDYSVATSVVTDLDGRHWGLVLGCFNNQYGRIEASILNTAGIEGERVREPWCFFPRLCTQGHTRHFLVVNKPEN